MQGEIDRSQPLDEFPASQHRPVPRTVAEYLEEMRDRNQAIVAAFASGGYTLQAIGEYFGLHYSRVSRIVSRAKGKT
jgi:putative transposase